MTPDEIRKLAPGPELDRVVGETLFACEPGPLARLQRYSTTWAGLGLVVEEMERRDRPLELWSMGQDWPEESRRRASFGVDEGAGRTVPEAVCRAALLALAAEKGKTP